MSSSAAYASESIIGPPSGPINVVEFVENGSNFLSGRGNELLCGLDSEWLNLPDEKRRQIEDECNVDDLRKMLDDTLSDPFQYAHISQRMDNSINAALSSSKNHTQNKSRLRKRKRGGADVTDITQTAPEAAHLKKTLDVVKLQCWPYPKEADVFIRPLKNSDLNVLTTLMPNSLGHPKSLYEAILIISVYNRLSWGNHLSRSSQHAVLSLQTLGDLYGVIPCPSNEIPSEESSVDLIPLDSDSATNASQRGCVICMEDVAYGDGRSSDDYSSKLLAQLELMPEKKRPTISQGPSMHDVRFVDLTIRLNQPYWLLHQGACEHFIVVDHIRMLHASDPQDGYPLTLQITPPNIDLCMSCARVPAKLSVVGGTRLGQSPFKICRPCWSNMGPPQSSDVKVLMLPTYEPERLRARQN